MWKLIKILKMEKFLLDSYGGAGIIDESHLI